MMNKIYNHEILDMFELECLKNNTDSPIHSIDNVELFDMELVDTFSTIYMFKGMSKPIDDEDPKYWAIKVQFWSSKKKYKSEYMRYLVDELEENLNEEWSKDNRKFTINHACGKKENAKEATVGELIAIGVIHGVPAMLALKKTGYL